MLYRAPITGTCLSRSVTLFVSISRRWRSSSCAKKYASIGRIPACTISMNSVPITDRGEAPNARSATM